MATGKAKNTEERRTTAARSKTAAAKRAATRALKLPWYRRLFHNVGVPEIVIAGVSTAVTVWAWLAFVVTQPQDYVSFLIAYGIAMFGGSVVHFVLPFIFGWAGIFTSRLRSSTAKADDAIDTTCGSGVVYWGPVLVSVIAFLVVTPPSTPTGDFGDFPSIYNVILVMGLLGLIGVGLGMLVILLIAMPIMMLIGAALPDRRSREVRERDPLSRVQSAAMGGIMLLIVTFAVGMYFVGDGGGPPHSSFGRMRLQFINLVTLQGNMVAIIVVVLSVIGIVLLGIVSNRAADKRLRSFAGPKRDE